MHTEKNHQSIADFTVQSMQPLSVVPNKSFCNMLKVIEIRYEPTCTTNIVKILLQRYEKVKQKIQQAIKNLLVAITHDGWTSMNTEGYETVTCSYISDS